MKFLICPICGQQLDDEDYVSSENGSPAHRECVKNEEEFNKEK